MFWYTKSSNEDFQMKKEKSILFHMYYIVLRCLKTYHQTVNNDYI